MSKEEWKEIPGFEEFKVSTLGRVVRTEVKRNRFKYTQTIPEQFIVPHISDFGYEFVTLSRQVSRVKTNLKKRVHILVAEAFIPNPNNFHYVRHVNGNIRDNRVDNLEWVRTDIDFSIVKGGQKNKKGIRSVTLFGAVSVIIDSPIIDEKNGKVLTSYSIWHNVLDRCYNPTSKRKLPTYEGCIVCDEWLTFSNFKKWFDANYIEGYEIDKDILIQGNKIYSPSTCCFVPHAINSLFNMRRAVKRDIPIGVHRNKDKYRVAIHEYGAVKTFGSFNTPEEAFCAYKKERERYIREVADKYFSLGLIKQNVRDAMYNHKIEIK